MDERYKAYPFAGGLIYLDVDESPAMRKRAEGRYEPHKIAALQRLLEPGMTFVDAGANKGDFSLIAARAMNDDGRVLAFEPAPENARWVRASVELNGYQSVTVLEMALTDNAGRVPLYLGEWSGWHSLVRRPRSAESIEVEARTLDAMLADTSDPHVDVLKIDVEGAELSLLRGATQTLADPRLFAILIDLHPALGVDATEVWQAIAGQGFGLRDPEDLDAELTGPPAGAKELVALRPSVERL